MCVQWGEQEVMSYTSYGSSAAEKQVAAAVGFYTLLLWKKQEKCGEGQWRGRQSREVAAIQAQVVNQRGFTHSP